MRLFLLPLWALVSSAAAVADDADPPVPVSAPIDGAPLPAKATDPTEDPTEDKAERHIAGSGQLLVITTPSWASKTGRLQRYERGPSGFVAVGDSIEIVVGGSGMGWGIGLHGVSPGEPRKMEGDGRAPAGVFRLTRAFGKERAPQTGLPSAKINKGDVCVDDVGHAAYNTIVPAAAPVAPYKSAEQLFRKDWLYDELIVVDQNHADDAAAPIKGRGSCVFLHVWRRKGSGTAGCTAMDPRDLSAVLAWLDAAKAPVLVQVPSDVYDGVRPAWGLPARPR
jgi:D-alanyl-D-alanine dipeptidase